MAKLTRKRSPAYPSVGLREAIDRADQLHKVAHDLFAPIEAAAECWQYKVSATSQVISALKQFGLVEDRGTGEDRELKLTPLALDVLMLEPTSSEYLRSLQTAALRPKIHAELWDKYDGNVPHSDTSIKVYLVRQREEGTFNPAYVDGFIEQFRDTISFAKLSSSDTGNDVSTRGDQEDDGNLPADRQCDPRLVRRKQHQVPGTKEDVYTLATGDVVLQWPDRISPEEAEDLNDWLDIMKRKLKRSVVFDDAQSPFAENE